MILPTLGFGIPNLLARGDKTKYFPEQFIQDVFPTLRADEIVKKLILCDMDYDGDILTLLKPDGDRIVYWVNIVKNQFEKIEPKYVEIIPGVKMNQFEGEK